MTAARYNQREPTRIGQIRRPMLIGRGGLWQVFTLIHRPLIKTVQSSYFAVHPGDSGFQSGLAHQSFHTLFSHMNAFPLQGLVLRYPHNYFILIMML